MIQADRLRKDPFIQRKCEEGRRAAAEYGDAVLYKFCSGCEFKEMVMRDGKFVKVRCPARFNPFESPLDDNGNPRKDGRGCPKNAKFMEIEEKKNKYVREHHEKG